MKRALLLDMDGVVFHHPRVSQQVAHRIARLVQRAVMPPTEQGPAHRAKAYALNEELYKKHGHTLLGLRAVYQSSMTLEEFNARVYTPAMLRYMARKADLPMRLRGDEVARLLVRAAVLDAPVYVFSNAPARWCEAILAELGLTGYIPADRVIGCDHPVFCGGTILKPNPVVYSKMSLHVRAEHRGQMVLKYFVDDSLPNLRAVRDRKTWVPIWFSPRRASAAPAAAPATPLEFGGPHENRNICLAGTLAHAGDYLELL